ncbi:MAG: hypothetical protein FWD29_08995 [Micrococcales bacterium]|nr:hypothetical protein [Micrococcales bacterium]
MMTSPEYVAARSVLLDALEALHDHLDNLIMVGAQAVYLHTGEGTVNVPSQPKAHHSPPDVCDAVGLKQVAHKGLAVLAFFAWGILPVPDKPGGAASNLI